MYDPYKPLLYDQRTDSDENNTLYKIRNLLQHIKNISESVIVSFNFKSYHNFSFFHYIYPRITL